MADLFLKVVFDSSNTFNSCGAVKSEPLLIPVITTMECSDKLDTDGTNSNSVRTLLKQCKVKDVKDVRPRFDRACPRDIFLACHCGQIHREVLHNVCVGRNRFDSILKKYSLKRIIEIMRRTSFQEITWPHDENQCTVLNTSSNYEEELPSPYVTSDRLFYLRVTPVTTGHTTESAKFKNDSFVAKSVETTLNVDDSISFEVEFTHTLEKRIRCEGRHNFLSQCQLFECSQSAMLSVSPHSPNRYGDWSCVVPDRAVILQSDPLLSVELCTCLRAQTVLSRLGKWLVMRNRQSVGTSVFHLHTRSQDMVNMYNYRLQFRFIVIPTVLASL